MRKAGCMIDDLGISAEIAVVGLDMIMHELYQ
jgi:hypothetical protein